MSDPTSFAQRACPVCLQTDGRHVFRQQFARLSEGSLMEGYDITLCNRCGAAFADHIPGQPVFDKYYADMSKYEHGDRDGRVSNEDLDICKKTADHLAPFIGESESIADIGCATGALLAEFKRRGFNNVTGFDPSHACCVAARKLYDIEVREAVISKLGNETQRFDIVMMTGVLEHLCDVEFSLRSVTGLLKPGGRIFISVPDASCYHKWFSAPFQFFSMEHINFFSPGSLANLMLRMGFENLLTQRVPRYLGPKAVEPVVMSLFKMKTVPDLPEKLKFDNETGTALEAYIAASQAVENHLTSTINLIAETKTPIYVWGAGTHTLRLLDNGGLAKANILAFIDSNRNYQGKSWNGISIIPPSDVHNLEAPILISSHVAELEIKKLIVEKLKLPNRIITLYENAPLSI